MKQHLPNALKFVLFLGIGLFLVYWSWNGFDVDTKKQMWESLAHTNYFWLLLSIVFALLSHVSRAYRSQMLLAPVGNMPSLSNSFLAVMIGYLVNLAFPRLGEVVRCGTLYRYEKIPVNTALGTVITERIIDIMMLLVVVGLSIVLQFNIIGNYFFNEVVPAFSAKLGALFSHNALLLWLGLAVVGTLMTGLFIYVRKRFKHTQSYQKIQQIIEGLGKGVQSVKDVPNLPLFIAHSVFIWLMYFAMIYACFFSFPHTSHLGPLVGLVVLAMGTFAIIATPGGIGAYPLIVAAVLSLYGISYEMAYVFGWIAWTTQTFLVIVAGFVSLLALPIVNATPQAKLDE